MQGNSQRESGGSVSETVLLAVLAVVGTVVGGAVGTWSQAHVTRKSEHVSWLRDQRTAVYGDAVGTLLQRERSLDYWQDPHSPITRGASKVPEEPGITARMLLLGSADAERAGSPIWRRTRS